MAESCVRCASSIAGDGYCSGCGFRPDRTAGDVAVNRARCGRSLYVLFIAAAVALFGFASVPSRFEGVGSIDDAEPMTLWWVTAAITSTMVAVAQVLLTRYKPSTVARVAVWSGLVASWIFGAYLGWHSAKSSRRAAQRVGETELSQTLRDQRDELIRDHGRDLQARAKLDLDSPAARRASNTLEEAEKGIESLFKRLKNKHRELDEKYQDRLDELNKAIDGEVKQLAKSDGLLLQSRLHMGAMLCAMAAVVSLLLLVASEQSWARRFGMEPPPAPVPPPAPAA